MNDLEKTQIRITCMSDAIKILQNDMDEKIKGEEAISLAEQIYKWVMEGVK